MDQLTREKSVIKRIENKRNLMKFYKLLQGRSAENMLKKLGFLNEGYLRKYVYFRDKHQDLNMFSLLKD